MGVLAIELLGGFAIQRQDKTVVPLRSNKSRALLAYLAIHPDESHSRVTLAKLLWPEASEKTARANLTSELSHCRKHLGQLPALVIERSHLCLLSAHCQVDVLALNEAYQQAKQHNSAECFERLAQLLEQRTGEFLADFEVKSSERFDEWVSDVRQQLLIQRVEALKLLLTYYSSCANWSRLAAVAHLLLRIDPWQEPANLCLIQALVEQDQLSDARRHYQHFCELLVKELQTSPSEQMQKQVNQWLTQQQTPKSFSTNLPEHDKIFIGREAEIRELQQLVASERLVSLLGLGGVGKSNLAQAVGRRMLGQFQHGVWFVPLASIDANHPAALMRVAYAMASAIKFQITDVKAPFEELLQHLHDKHLLLVLDNWEQLVDIAESVFLPLLQQTPVHILATSRTRLLRDFEAPFSLRGLPAYDAYSLFVSRAGLSADTAREQAYAIHKICDQVGGLPLGIELAAAGAATQSLAEIGDQLVDMQTEVVEDAHGQLDRHANLATVLEYSWRLLSPKLQSILCQASVFQSGFDRDAAIRVVGARYTLLSALSAHSLLQVTSAGRYDLHPVVREFARSKLTKNTQTDLLKKHSEYYLSLLQSVSPEQRSERLLPDFDNLQAAWLAAVAREDYVVLGASASRFGDFCRQAGRLFDGDECFQQALMVVCKHDEYEHIHAQLLEQQWQFTRALRDLQCVRAEQIQLLALTQAVEPRIHALTDLAWGYAEEGDWLNADARFDELESLSKQSSEPLHYLKAIQSRNYVNVVHFRGDFAACIRRLKAMLADLDADPSPITEAGDELRHGLWVALIVATIRYGNYAESMRYSSERMNWVSHFAHKHRRVRGLLDIALAEQFAGMYPQAIAHNREALALAEQAGAFNDAGLLKANLCLTLRQTGSYTEALDFGLQAVQALNAMGLSRMEGQTRNRVGHAYLKLQRFGEARLAYEAAFALLDTLHHPNRFEASAGLAVALLHLGQREQALEQINHVLAYVETEGLSGLVEPALLILNCEAVLNALGQLQRAENALKLGYQWVQTIAERISDSEMQDSFLHKKTDVCQLRLRLNAYLERHMTKIPLKSASSMGAD